jgi:hypothetical protein
MKDYMILSKHWKVGEDVPQKTFDDVIMHDVANNDGMEKPANLLRWHGEECKKDRMLRWVGVEDNQYYML